VTLPVFRHALRPRRARRGRARGAAFALALGLGAGLGAAAGAAGCGGDTPPHLVLIVVDTLRRDHVSAYADPDGDAPPPARTPHIDALAADGTRIDAVSSYHQTTMSMGALFTGRTPSIASGSAERPVLWRPETWCGMGRFLEDTPAEQCLPEALPTLGEALGERGYTTLGVVANALLFRPAGFARGFDRWVEVGEFDRRAPEEAARGRTWEHVNAGVRRALDARPPGPLFLYVHYLDAHDHHFLGLDYAEAVERADAGVGDLLRLLAERGLRDDAVIVLTSDHGERLDEEHVLEGFPAHGGNPSFRTLLEVPLVVTGADVPPLPPLVRSEDVHRLLLRVAGAPELPRSDLEARELFVSERLYRTYLRGRFKSFWSRDGEFVLVDLESDPGETRNVTADHPDVAAAHRERVDALTRALAAPQLEPGRTPEEFRRRLRALGYLE